MQLTSVELWQRIAALEIATSAQCRNWAAEVVAKLDASEANDADKLLDQLVDSGFVTPFQADCVGREDTRLRHGNCLIRQPATSPLWQDWFETQCDDGQVHWMRWLSSNDLSGLKNGAPSLKRATTLSKLRHTNLQQVRFAESIPGELAIAVQPLDSMQALSQTPKHELASRSMEIVQAVGEALSSLHSAGVTHGRVLPDRVFVDSKSVLLVCDPLALKTAVADPAARGIVNCDLGRNHFAQFIAPEFLAPGQVPTPATDVYSLGCLWWWLMVGEPPNTGKDTASAMAAHASPAAQLPRDNLLAPPIKQCLRHALARNVEARFPSAVEFCTALNVAMYSAASTSSTIAEPDQVEHDKKGMKKNRSRRGHQEPVEVMNADTSASERAPAKTPRKTSKQTVKDTPQVAAQKVTQKASPKSDEVLPAVDSQRPAGKSQEAPTGSGALGSPKNGTGKPVANDAQLIAGEKTAVTGKPVSVGTPKGGVRGKKGNPSDDSQNTAVEAKSGIPAKIGTATKPVASVVRKTRTRRKKNNKWLVPTVGGCGFMIVLLLILKFSGALQPAENENENQAVAPYTPPPAVAPPERDAREQFYNIVASRPDGLWLPPSAPSPIPIDLLPPGGQIFLSIRPKSLIESEPKKELLGNLDGQLSPLLSAVKSLSGQPLENIRQATLALYSPRVSGGIPEIAMRVQLANQLSLGDLKQAWKTTQSKPVGDAALLATGNGPGDRGVFVPEQPLVDTQAVSLFSVGPMSIMRDVAEQEGAAGPLTTQIAKLWQASDVEMDISVLASPSFAFSDGRWIVQQCPERLATQLQDLFALDVRAVLMQSTLQSQWYFELQMIGVSDRDAGPISTKLSDRIRQLPNRIESWFVDESPHAAWRAIAIRYPQMLRVVSQYSRVGVERGVAIANFYLPKEAAANVLLASWLAVQPGATQVDMTATQDGDQPSVSPLSIEEYLGRPIRLSFDQEPIEVALTLVGEEANESLPAGTPKLRFALDGDAFENAGITRNQQLSDFQHLDLPMRDALTEIAKRGNPVTTVTDLRVDDQKLLWVVREDSLSPGNLMVSLTTRAAATAAGIPLPVEFAPPTTP